MLNGYGTLHLDTSKQDTDVEDLEEQVIDDQTKQQQTRVQQLKMQVLCELSSFILDTLERVVAVSIVFKRQNSASLNQQKVGLVTTAIAKCRSLF